MKSAHREFNKTEKALIVVLALLLLGLAYYQFAYRPISEEINKAHSERDALEVELMGVQMRLNQLSKMQAELNRIGTDSGRMESYNNSKAELALLNNTLVDAQQYSITFADVTRDGDQIRRNFSLQFTTDSFASAKRILTKLTASEYRCLLGDVDYALVRTTDASDESVRESVNVSVNATFYETMVGGKPDAGLPADSAK